MNIKELMRMVDSGTNVELWDEECSQIAKFEVSPTGTPDAYGSLEVESIGVDTFDGEPTLVISCERPTWKISCSITVDVSVTVKAFTEEEAMSKVERIDADDLINGYGFDDDVEHYDTSYGDVEWEDAERW